MKKITLAIVLAFTIVSCNNDTNESNKKTETKEEAPVPPSKQTDLQSEHLSGNVKARVIFSSRPATLNDKNEWVATYPDNNIYDVEIYTPDGYMERQYKIATDTIAMYEYNRLNNDVHMTAYEGIRANGAKTYKAIGYVHNKFTDDNTLTAQDYWLSGKDSMLVTERKTVQQIISGNEKKYTSQTISYKDGKQVNEVQHEATEIISGDTMTTTVESGRMVIVRLEKDNMGNVTKLLVLQYEGNNPPITEITRFRYEYYPQ